MGIWRLDGSTESEDETGTSWGWGHRTGGQGEVTEDRPRKGSRDEREGYEAPGIPSQ